jgi:hypothetical protein
MARRPSRGGPAGPAYSVMSKAKLKRLSGPREYHYSGGVAYSVLKSAPREAASGKRSYRDSRGRTRWGKPHVVQRYHEKRRS